MCPETGKLRIKFRGNPGPGSPPEHTSKHTEMKRLLQSGSYWLILAYKALKAVFLLLVAFALSRAVEKHLPGGLQRLLDHWFVAPERDFYSNIADPLRSVMPKALKWAASASFLCGLLTLVETVGLLRRISLLTWLVIIDSGFFVCLGLFSLTRQFSLGGLVLAAINAFIAWYLLKHLPKSAKGADSPKPAPKKPKKDPKS